MYFKICLFVKKYLKYLNMPHFTSENNTVAERIVSVFSYGTMKMICGNVILMKDKISRYTGLGWVDLAQKTMEENSKT